MHDDGVTSKSRTDQPRLEEMRPSEILRDYEIDRATRTADGRLTGFQRQPVLDHIRRSAEHVVSLGPRDRVFYNPIILGEARTGVARRIDGTRPRGFVIDGQQRLLACRQAGFDEAVGTLTWRFETAAELAAAFIRINAVRPLPKALVAEIAPSIANLPARLTDGTLAALLVEALNYDEGSPLRGQVRQHTNPNGVIRDTALARGLRRSIAGGMLAPFATCQEAMLTQGLAVACEWFHAVRTVFRTDWDGHCPRTSRLLHSTGIEAIVNLMDVVGATTETGGPDGDDFRHALVVVAPYCRWTSGTWGFPNGMAMPHGALQNVPSHVATLSGYLADVLLGATGRRRAAA